MEVTKKDLETIIYGTRKKEDDHPISGLMYVRVEPGKLVATNGKVLIVRELTKEIGENFEPFCISVADIRSAIRENAALWGSNGQAVHLDPGNDFMAKIGRSSVAKQDDAYPDWPKVMKGARKDIKGHKMSRFDPAVLMTALQGMKDVKVVELRNWDENKPIRIDGLTADGRKVLSLVMPIVRK